MSFVIVSKINKQTLTNNFNAILYLFQASNTKSSCHLIIERSSSIDIASRISSKLLDTTSQISRKQVCKLLGLIQKSLGFIGTCATFFQNSGESPDNWEKLISFLGGHQVGVREGENT